MRAKLTEKNVESSEEPFSPPTSGFVTIWDSEIEGFGLRITAANARSYVFRYRSRVVRAKGGSGAPRQRKMVVGHVGDIKVGEARDLAREFLVLVRKGLDPKIERSVAQARAAAEADPEDEVRSGPLISKVIDSFIEKYAIPKRPRTAPHYRRVLNRRVRPTLGNIRIRALRRGDVVAFLDSLVASHNPLYAHDSYSVLRKLLNWYATRDDQFVSPLVKGMSPCSTADYARTRVLSDEELRDIWLACDSVNSTYAGIVRVLMLTSQRLRDITNAKWSEIKNGVLEIPKARYKGKRDHSVPLSETALRIIKQQPKRGPFIFTTTGDTGYSGFHVSKQLLDQAISKLRTARGEDDDMPPWVLHDFRRTFMSRATDPALGVTPDVAERVLGHAMPALRAVYDRSIYMAPKRDALTVWEQHILSLIQPSPAGTSAPAENVVSMAERRKASAA